MENIEKEKFVNYTLEEDKDKSSIVISLKLNEEEQKQLKEAKKILEQEKDGTAIKQLMFIAIKVLLEEKTQTILGVVYANKRKNKRLGIITFD